MARQSAIAKVFDNIDVVFKYFQTVVNGYDKYSNSSNQSTNNLFDTNTKTGADSDTAYILSEEEMSPDALDIVQAIEAYISSLSIEPQYLQESISNLTKEEKNVIANDIIRYIIQAKDPNATAGGYSCDDSGLVSPTTRQDGLTFKCRFCP